MSTKHTIGFNAVYSSRWCVFWLELPCGWLCNASTSPPPLVSVFACCKSPPLPSVASVLCPHTHPHTLSLSLSLPHTPVPSLPFPSLPQGLAVIEQKRREDVVREVVSSMAAGGTSTPAAGLSALEHMVTALEAVPSSPGAVGAAAAVAVAAPSPGPYGPGPDTPPSAAPPPPVMAGRTPARRRLAALPERQRPHTVLAGSMRPSRAPFSPPPGSALGVSRLGGSLGGLRKMGSLEQFPLPVSAVPAGLSSTTPALVRRGTSTATGCASTATSSSPVGAVVAPADLDGASWRARSDSGSTVMSSIARPSPFGCAPVPAPSWAGSRRRTFAGCCRRWRGGLSNRRPMVSCSARRATPNPARVRRWRRCAVQRLARRPGHCRCRCPQSNTRCPRSKHLWVAPRCRCSRWTAVRLLLPRRRSALGGPSCAVLRCDWRTTAVPTGAW